MKYLLILLGFIANLHAYAENRRAPVVLHDTDIAALLDRPFGVCRFVHWKGNFAARALLVKNSLLMLNNQEIEVILGKEKLTITPTMHSKFRLVLGKLITEERLASRTLRRLRNDSQSDIDELIADLQQILARISLDQRPLNLTALKSLALQSLSLMKMIDNDPDVVLSACDEISKGSCEVIEMAGHSITSLSMERSFGINIERHIEYDNQTMISLYPDRIRIPYDRFFTENIDQAHIDGNQLKDSRSLQTPLEGTRFAKVAACFKRIAKDEKALVIFSTCGGHYVNDHMEAWANKQPAHVLLSHYLGMSTISSVGPSYQNQSFWGVRTATGETDPEARGWYRFDP